MTRRVRRGVILKSIVKTAIAVILISAASIKADIILTSNEVGPTMVSHDEGGSLSDAPDYNWWYGCSPTSGGMMMGYYDRNGYNMYLYDNLLPGVVAESSNYGNPGAAANQMIASNEHIADFYVGGYGASGDDVTPPFHSFNSLADFMGTSQDSVGNSNGFTTFWYWDNGAPLTANDIYSAGASYYNDSGMYGLWEYEQYSGYGSGGVASQMIYNQYIDTLGLTYGFTWDQYKAEIDAGRPVMIHVEGHSMFGYGYDDATTEIILHDTWVEGEHRMVWGGAYPYWTGVEWIDLGHYGVTVFEPTGGVLVPVPAAVLLGILGLGVVGIKLRKYA